MNAMQTTAVKRLSLVDIAQEVGVLTINRPESLNALNGDVLDELQKALEALEGDAAVKVVVITGAGGKAFVSGGDIKEMLALDPAGAELFSRKGQALVLSIERMSKPVIAAVNGYALGGGLELALACDFIYASENARFGFRISNSFQAPASRTPGSRETPAAVATA